MKILLVEDDYLTAEGLINDLKNAFPALEIDHFSTESEFREKLETVMKHPPKAMVFDVMIRWTDPKEEMPIPPAEVKENGPWRAGLRCVNLLRKRNSQIPVILYSVLEPEDLKGEIPENVMALVKSPDPAEIIEEMRKLGVR